jgi:hypothetical protein
MPGPVLHDRQHAQIDIGCEKAVDLQLRVAGGLALFQRRIIEERELHRALDLHHPLACEEHRRAMRVDACHLRAAMRGGIGQEREHGVLRRLAMAVGHDRCANLSLRRA